MQDRPKPASDRYCRILAARIFCSLCMLPFLWNCQPAPTDSGGPSAFTVEPIAWWDTAFTVSGAAFPGDAVSGRAIVETGNNFRLGRFLSKCRSGDTVRIGFIGGSITEGAVSASVPSRYSSRFCRFLRQTFPLADIEELNAGIGATNSRFGCSRLQQDLLDRRPDMVVIEFAVNDDPADPAGSEAAIEGLIRRTLQDPDVPVLLFHTMNSRGDNTIQEAQARIARHYALPVISYRDACWPLIEAGILPWAEVSADIVHPNDKGHLIGGYLLYDFLKRASSAIEGRPDGPFAIPPILTSDLYQHAGILASGTTLLEIRERQGWDVSVDDKQRYNFRSHAMGDRLVIRTRAREATAMFLISHALDSEIRVSLDGIIVATLSNHFASDPYGEYLIPRLLYKAGQDEERTLEFVNVSGGEFDLRYLLYAE